MSADEAADDDSDDTAESEDSGDAGEESFGGIPFTEAVDILDEPDDEDNGSGDDGDCAEKGGDFAWHDKDSDKEYSEGKSTCKTITDFEHICILLDITIIQHKL